MIRITDMTLCMIAPYGPSPSRLKALFELLLRTGCDFIEMPEAAYDLIRPSETGNIALRISGPGETARYPGIGRFVCRKSGLSAPFPVTSELQLNDVKEIGLLAQQGGAGCIRAVGLDDVLFHNYKSAFAKMLRLTGGRIELCPENSRFCATAAAVEWIMNGGVRLAVSFGGIGNKAATEEVMLALRLVKRHRPNASFAVFSEIADLIEEITPVRFADRKPVIGRGIFNVESGIHVDGILKKPQMYESFPPELVGGERKLFIGKHSGRKSVAAKLEETGNRPENFDLGKILGEVRYESVGKMSSLSDDEFLGIAFKHRRLKEGGLS